MPERAEQNVWHTDPPPTPIYIFSAAMHDLKDDEESGSRVQPTPSPL